MKPINLALHLNLTRSLTCFDVETTGVGEDDRIIQLGITKHYPEGKEPVRWVSLVNPEMPIPPEVSRVHGITDDNVAKAPKFADIVHSLVRALTHTDFLGHGVTFDLKKIRGECRRVGIDWNWETSDSRVIDTLRLRQVTMPNDLSTCYQDITGEKLDNAHDAGIDVMATEIVLAGQLERYSLPRNIAELAAVCWPKKADWIDATGKLVWRNGEACLGFGKHNGKPLKNCDKGYLSWILGQDFPSDFKTIIIEAKAGRFPVKET